MQGDPRALGLALASKQRLLHQNYSRFFNFQRCCLFKGNGKIPMGPFSIVSYPPFHLLLYLKIKMCFRPLVISPEMEEVIRRIQAVKIVIAC